MSGVTQVRQQAPNSTQEARVCLLWNDNRFGASAGRECRQNVVSGVAQESDTSISESEIRAAKVK
ncbi:unnamed protein product [Gemmata massiliana]|uniref:Uncharacterized protein n=1 Tax=Gemmata massiliana TaxID=1210884 RepID=A0A6P2CSH0_9BACT|nr:unnamed protein product [Gemmata massiliana]